MPLAAPPPYTGPEYQGRRLLVGQMVIPSAIAHVHANPGTVFFLELVGLDIIGDHTFTQYRQVKNATGYRSNDGSNRVNVEFWDCAAAEYDGDAEFDVVMVGPIEG